MTASLPPLIFAHSRGVVTAQYAVMPPEGVLESRLPGFTGVVARILTAPPMGARFAQMLLEIAPGGGTLAPRNDGLEHVFYLLSGALQLELAGAAHPLAPGGYAYAPVGAAYHLHNPGPAPARLMWIKRPYEAIHLPPPAPLVGRRADLPRENRQPDGRYWQYLLPPGDMAFDLEVNILGFGPGAYFPCVETHIMEHGLYMLEGQGLYLLAGDLHEVQTADFIWMGPYCPQFFYCTGQGEAAYLLYKDVNRDVHFD